MIDAPPSKTKQNKKLPPTWTSHRERKRTITTQCPMGGAQLLYWPMSLKAAERWKRAEQLHLCIPSRLHLQVQPMPSLYCIPVSTWIKRLLPPGLFKAVLFTIYSLTFVNPDKGNPELLDPVTAFYGGGNRITSFTAGWTPPSTSQYCSMDSATHRY